MDGLSTNDEGPGTRAAKIRKPLYPGSRGSGAVAGSTREALRPI